MPGLVGYVGVGAWGAFGLEGVRECGRPHIERAYGRVQKGLYKDPSTSRPHFGGA